MSRHPVLSAVLLLYVIWSARNWYSDRPFHPPDGVLAVADPAQNNVPDAKTVRLGRWTLTVRADYLVTARILGLERYHFDALSDLVPEDLALGWGPMSDNRNLRFIDISQSNRFYYWRMTANTPIGREAIPVRKVCKEM